MDKPKLLKTQLGFKFSKKYIWQLFLTVAFPIHFWALIMWFQEFDAITAELDSWAAFGEGGYFLIFALFESSIIFLMLILLLRLLPKKWPQDKVFIHTATLYLMISSWFMLEQIRFLEIMPEDNWLVARLQMASLHTNTGKVLVVIILASIGLSLILLNKSEKMQNAVSSLLERLTILSCIYLSLDAVEFIIIAIRNIN